MVDNDFVWQVCCILPSMICFTVLLLWTVILTVDVIRRRIGGWRLVVCVGAVASIGLYVILSFYFPSPGSSESVRAWTFCTGPALAIPFLSTVSFNTSFSNYMRIMAGVCLVCVVWLLFVYIIIRPAYT